MPEETIDRIRELCRAWLDAAMEAGGGLVIGEATESYRLTANGIVPHRLSHGELRATVVGLTSILLMPGSMNTVIDRDHLLCWGWCREVLLGTPGFFASEEHEMRQLLDLSFRAALAPAFPSGSGQASDMLLRLGPSAFELILRSHTVLVYLGFPTLEAVLKKAGAEFVDYDGRVRKPFGPPWREQPYRVGQRCSRVGDLLYLVWAEVASRGLRADLDEMRSHLSAFGPSDPFETVDRWRNESLHAEASLPTVGGTVLALAVIVGLARFEEEYESLRDQIRNNVHWQLETARFVGHFTLFECYAAVWASVFGIDRPLNAGSEQHTSE